MCCTGGNAILQTGACILDEACLDFFIWLVSLAVILSFFCTKNLHFFHAKTETATCQSLSSPIKYKTVEQTVE